MQRGQDVEASVADAPSFQQYLDRLRQAAEWGDLPFHRRLRRIRMARGWSHQKLAMRMVLIARQHRGTTASAGSLKNMVGRWERGTHLPDERNRRLLADTLEVAVGDLGLSEDPDFFW